MKTAEGPHLSVRPSAWRMLAVGSPILVLLVLPRLLLGGDRVFGRVGWAVFAAVIVLVPFVVVRLNRATLDERGVTVHRAVRTHRMEWPEIGRVMIESRGRFLVLVVKNRRGPGRAEMTLNFVSKADRRRLVELIDERSGPGVVLRNDCLVSALGG